MMSREEVKEEEEEEELTTLATSVFQPVIFPIQFHRLCCPQKEQNAI
jgi:hypothetical protein